MSARKLRPGERIRVLVVDDSVVIRRLITHALEQDPEVEVVGAASNGTVALQKIPQLKPDILTLDIEMPEMDGLETLRRVRSEFPSLRVIMFSTLTERGAAVTLEALSLGADDYVGKASNEGSLDRSMSRLREELVPKFKQFFQVDVGLTAVAAPAQASERVAAIALKLETGTRANSASELRAKQRFQLQSAQVVVIGVSTGGPTALGEILPQIPGSFPLPILVVQHMPPMFTRLLAERLNASCNLLVQEAKQGELVAPGRILIAPGDYHMRVAQCREGVCVSLDQGPPQNSCRPAVDALFQSASEIYGRAALAVVLTGMGQDGLQGSHALKAKGATVLAQDEASSVVWGMPGAVVGAGLADRVIPLRQVVPEILLTAGRS